MSKVQESDLYFLVLHWLRSGPCRAASDALQQELQQLSLLPTVPTMRAQIEPDYETLRRAFKHIPTSALHELVDESVELQRDAVRQAFESSGSILEATGSLSLIPSVRTQVTLSTLAHPPPSCRPNFMQLLLQRESGIPWHRLRNADLMDNVTSAVYSDLHHVKTIRGHRKAVYCVALDRKKTRVITGADDGLIKIWNLEIGLLETTCRGHLGEITDLRINCDESLFASCSIDGTSRVWSLNPSTLGHHIQSMRGHQDGVTYMSFHPMLPHALLSVSLDGTCRLWHVLTGIELLRLKPIGQTGHFYNRGAFEKSLNQAIARQREIHFYPELSENDFSLTCCAFSPSGMHFAVSSHSGRCFIWHWDVDHYLENNPDMTQTWPDASYPMELADHQDSVPLLLFSHLGNALCTASLDGKIKIWKPMKNGKSTLNPTPTNWVSRWSFVLPDPLPCSVYNTHRRRSSPQCNQIAWSCDDQYLLAAYSCSVIMVWNALTGNEENILYGGHADSPVHVLETHPLDSKLCFSAGYDGMLILWDIINGRKLVALSSQDTHPGRWHWADPIQFVDGRFQPDGMGIVVSDVAGQFHIYGLDKPGMIMQRTPYDQFFLYDYDKVIINDKGEPIDMESGELQHVHNTRFSMVDITEEPYEPSVQELLRDRKHLQRLPAPSVPPKMPAALLSLPATMSAAMWLADESGLGPQATASRVASAQRRQIELMQEEGALEEIVDLLPQLELEEPPELPENEPDDDSEGSEYTPDEGDPSNSPLITRRSERIQTRGEEHRPAPTRRRIPTRQNPDVGEEEDAMDLIDDLDTEMTEPLTPDESDGLSEFDFSSSEEDDIDMIEALRPRRAGRPRVSWRITLPRPPPESQPERRSQRLRRPRVITTSSPDDTPPRRSNGASARSQRAARRAAVARSRSVQRQQRSMICFDTGRDLRTYQWLSETRCPVGYYRPQIGDDVVYFSKLHLKFAQDHPQLATRVDQCFADKVRFAEPCSVVQVHYEIYRGESFSPTVARVRLRFTDDDRFGKRSFFNVYIPPPSFGHEEFLITRHIFEKSMNVEWSIGQPVEAIYFTDHPEQWHGTIADIHQVKRSYESLWDCEGQHGRYLVEWLGMEDDDVDPEALSPWDMVHSSSLGSSSRQEREIFIGGEVRRVLLDAINKAHVRPEATHFRETVAPETSFVTSGRTRQETQTLFYNQVVPLPMSLELIRMRLKHSAYYKSVAGFRYDVRLIVENAHLFTEPGSGVSQQADELETFILQCTENEMDASDRNSSDNDADDDFKVSNIQRFQQQNRSAFGRECPTETRTSSNATIAATSSSTGAYQIRTRGMAKRDRESSTGGVRRTRRRRLNY